MISRLGAPFLFGSTVLLITGCASVSQKDAFQNVQNGIAASSGQRVVWNQSTADDAKAAAEVRHLLLKPLGANQAVQIALLSNTDLQATFEEIGVSQADLVQAGLLKNPTFAASWRFPDVPPGITDAEYAVAEDFLDLVAVVCGEESEGAPFAGLQRRPPKAKEVALRREFARACCLAGTDVLHRFF